LGTVLSVRASASSRINWQDWIVRREESWEEIKPHIFEEMISKERYPQVTLSIIIILMG